MSHDHRNPDRGSGQGLGNDSGRRSAARDFERMRTGHDARDLDYRDRDFNDSRDRSRGSPPPRDIPTRSSPTHRDQGPPSRNNPPRSPINHRDPGLPLARSDTIPDNTRRHSLAVTGSTSQIPNSVRDGDVKRMTEYICDRVYWFMRGNTADKRLKKLRAEIDRSQPSFSEYPSASELLYKQLNEAKAEKEKCVAGVNSLDSKIAISAQNFLGKQQQQPATETSRTDLDKIPSAEDFEARFKSIQHTLEDKMKHEMETRAKELKSVFETEYQGQISDLKSRLEGETEAKLLLKQKLDNVSQMLDQITGNSNQALVDQSGNMISLSAAVQQLGNQVASYKQDMTTLSTRFETFTETTATREQHDEKTRKAIQEEAKMTAESILNARLPLPSESLFNEETKKRLGSLESALSQGQADVDKLTSIMTKHGSNLSELKEQVQSLQVAIQTQEDKQCALEKELMLRQNSIPEATSKQEGQLLSDPSLMVPGGLCEGHIANSVSATAEQQILRILAPHIKTTENSLLLRFKSAADGFGKLIDAERLERENLAKHVTENVSLTTASNEDMDTLKKNVDALTSRAHEQDRNHQSMLAQQQQSFTTIRNSIEGTRRDFKLHLDELQMQIQCVLGWQNNFSTKDLYNHIVHHINATLPGGFGKRLDAVATRVVAIEARLSTDSDTNPTKRRKL